MSHFNEGSFLEHHLYGHYLTNDVSVAIQNVHFVSVTRDGRVKATFVVRSFGLGFSHWPTQHAAENFGLGFPKRIVVLAEITLL